MKKTKSDNGKVVRFPIEKAGAGALSKPLSFKRIPYCAVGVLNINSILKDNKLRATIQRRLVGKDFHVFPIQHLAEALDISVDTLRAMLDEGSLEIIRDDEGLLKNYYGLQYIDASDYVTTFGLQKLLSYGMARRKNGNTK